MAKLRPAVSRVYQSHSLDSTRWRYYEPRPGDVVIASSYKSGTTWVQHIVLQLLNDHSRGEAIWERSPWVESPLVPLDELRRTLDAEGRRVLKTHLPLDGLPLHEEIRYILVCRDPRDVCVSLWHHYRRLIRWPFLRMANRPDRVGPPLPSCPADIRAFCSEWLTAGWFTWESEGYPFWANLGHTRSWWPWRGLPNVLFVHYRWLSEDLAGAIRRIAAHIGIDPAGSRVVSIAAASQFSAMKAAGATLLPNAEYVLQGGADSFLRQGSSGQWMGMLDSEDLRLYRTVADRELPVDCVRWLERGILT